MKTIISMGLTLLLAFAMAACGSKSKPNETNKEPNMKTLVLYYSQTGATKAVAEALQRCLGADIEAIEVEEPYDGSYAETIASVQAEREHGVIPAIKPLKHNLKDYEIVFLGYPIWFGSYASPISALLQAVDLNDLKIVPFCTFGSGGLEASAKELQEQVPKAMILDGYGVRNARIAKMPAELNRFLIENSYVEGVVEVLPDFTEYQQITEEQATIFNAACGDYQYPLGMPLAYSQRQTPDGTEYKFSVQSQTPDGRMAASTIYVIDDGNTQEFTRVVR